MSELEDEINAIDAIYEGSVEKVTSSIFNFSIPGHEDLILQLSFPEEYPEKAPTVIQVAVKEGRKYTDTSYIERNVVETLKRVFNPGEVCIFELFTELEAFLDTIKREPVEIPIEKLTLEPTKVAKQEKPVKPEPIRHVATEDWIQSEPLLDRQSTFVAFVREVESVEQAKQFLDLLTADRKIARASHNISSWRIRREDGVQFQDFDDDGETAAGSRLLHLLTVCNFLKCLLYLLTIQMMDTWNVIVVVSRWFGGIHIGPDRFKHINTVAREVVIKGGFSKKK